MLTIKEINIKHFRSLYNVSINNITDLSLISGINDVGKSNILKALNLFFNSETDLGKRFDFDIDYNQSQKEYANTKSKQKQFIAISITFITGYPSRVLPHEFIVTKKWYRFEFEQTDDTNLRLRREKREPSARIKAEVTRFLNGFKYIYVSAIKDAHVFDNMMLRLRDTVFAERFEKSGSIKKALESVDSEIENATAKLNEEFMNVTSQSVKGGIQTKIVTPQDFAELVTTLSVKTKNSGEYVGLNLRGDGIRVRFLPSLLHFLAESSSYRYIWGFEEPENSLEYNLLLDNLDDYDLVYSDDLTKIRRNLLEIELMNEKLRGLA